MPNTAIFDVDGTLVDSNYQHTVAWFRAFRRFDVTLPLWRLHRAIGMGGDQLVPTVAGDEVEAEHGDALREAWDEEFKPLLGEIQPCEGAHELLKDVKARGFLLVLASSGTEELVETFMDLIDAKKLVDGWTTSDDAENSKPEPDIVRSALAKVGGTSGIMVGDSTWDVVAADKLHVPTIAIQTGGFSVEELQEAGAVSVYSSLVELRANLDRTLLARALD